MKTKIYNYPDAKDIVVSGDIHGDFNQLVYKMCIQYKMTNTLLIVAGDCGFGFEKTGYYENVYNHNEAKLKKSNNWILMVRGNHDDPSYFNEEKIRHERFRTIPDYSVVTACGRSILCVGGAISIDRSYRKDYVQSSSRQVYWQDEAPVYSPEMLSQLNKDHLIDTVISHTAPSFCELITKDGINGWTAEDPALIKDCNNERNVIDQIHHWLISNGHPLTQWFYGHFHQSWFSNIDGISYSMLDIMEFKELAI